MAAIGRQADEQASTVRSTNTDDNKSVLNLF